MADTQMRHKSADCKECGSTFTYPIGRGTTRRYCGLSCQRVSTHRAAIFRLASTSCSEHGCGKPIQNKSSGLCSMHLARLRRNGHLELVTRPRLADHSHGYKLLYSPNHPLATNGQRSRVYEHRAVFYDAHGEGPFSCHWCGQERTWADMHVDHLDDNKQNNVLANLVASCPECNQSRGKWKVKRTSRDRRSRQLTWRGKTQPLPDWAEEIGLSPTALKQRLRAGWSLDRAMTEPRGKFGPKGAGPA